ncbi:MAG: phosphoserine phosphatase SerB [Janthinobacterium lividum]
MDLVIQSLAPLSDADADTVRMLSSGAARQRIDPRAWRIEDAEASTAAAVAAWCQPRQVDYAFVARRALRDFGLFATDMDSTLITIECIDEIADFCGLKAQVAAITEASMRGEIKDFRESLTRRVALLRGLDVSALEQVYQDRLRLSPGAEPLLAGVKAAGLATLLVSGGFVFFTERLKARLGFDAAYANTLEVDHGKLTGRVLGEIVDASVKARHLLDTCAAHGVEASRSIAAGDGSNDLLMMKQAGLSVAFRAKPVVRAQADVALDFVGLDGILKLFV